jgi:hypothetical protein
MRWAGRRMGRSREYSRLRLSWHGSRMGRSAHMSSRNGSAYITGTVDQNCRIEGRCVQIK